MTKLKIGLLLGAGGTLAALGIITVVADDEPSKVTVAGKVETNATTTGAGMLAPTAGFGQDADAQVPIIPF